MKQRLSTGSRLRPLLPQLFSQKCVYLLDYGSFRIKVKGKPYYPDATACLPALMQTLCFDVPRLHIVNLAKIIPHVLRNTKNVDQSLVRAVLIPRLFQFFIIKLLMFAIYKNHVYVVSVLRPCS